uniref:Uncharacterized protein n=1 Tax=Coturnix japonica TaxID=93934 RepID=A0A8C2SQD2_COTJA
MSALPTGQGVLPASCPRVNTHQPPFSRILLTRVGVGDLVGLIGIQPHLLLPAAQHAGGQALLQPEHTAGNRAESSVELGITQYSSMQHNTAQYSSIRSDTACVLLPRSSGEHNTHPLPPPPPCCPIPTSS